MCACERESVCTGEVRERERVGRRMSSEQMQAARTNRESCTVGSRQETLTVSSFESLSLRLQ